MSFTIDDWGSDDIIDSRDIIERLEELTEEQADLVSDIEQQREYVFDVREDEEVLDAKDELAEMEKRLAEWETENLDELNKLKEIARQGEGYGDWSHGDVLVRDGYFKEYAQELAEEIGAIDRDARWPNTHIDWDQAARELQMDYTSIECDGHTYWMRA